MRESFWTRVQVERLNHRRWRTGPKLSTALFEYLEIFHDRQCSSPVALDILRLGDDPEAVPDGGGLVSVRPKDMNEMEAG